MQNMSYLRLSRKVDDKNIYMVLQILRYLCGVILLRAKAICFKRMRRLVSAKVYYISYGTTCER